LSGLSSGVLAAIAYLQITALGRAGEPEVRVVFYFFVFSCRFGVWLFDDAFGWIALLGITLIVAAGLAATYLQARTPRDARPAALHPPEA
jgi:S-adenosylmethionine uptake transporter